MSAERLHIHIQGAVQGVGFRPFVYRLATEIELMGWVNNTSQGVFIEVEGTQQQLETFLQRLTDERPPLALIQSVHSHYLPVVPYTSFEIRHSDASGQKTALVLPDVATCDDCLREVLDPDNRRYHYPFTNCTNCGPRYTIIEALPYDRPNTSMKHFPLCPACAEEYENPADRRFHAQPNACPVCGPHLECWNREGKTLATRHNALLETAEAIRNGQIVAIKGLGGFHLVVDARNAQAVEKLRKRKQRKTKPFALMVTDMAMAKSLCQVSELEGQWLTSPQAPIVLLKRTENSLIVPSVAPSNPYLGIMLPYTPLHHLLLHELGFPIVATSGNLTDEPICVNENEALERLSEIADVFLVHNRPIVRHVDDSVIQVMGEREVVLRRARGFAPLPIRFEKELPSVLATGAHLKNTIAISIKQSIFSSQHIGDLETVQAYDAFKRTINSFYQLYDFAPEAVACDGHPDYLSTQYARSLDLPLIHVQHHYAHALACLADNQLSPPALGISWDGTGYGDDGAIWGGEFLHINEDYSFTRAAHFDYFPLPGGEQAIKEPRRTAIGMLYAIYGEDAFNMSDLPPLTDFSEEKFAILRQMMQKQINAPLTSSVGRLFDGVAALLGLHQRVNFEGEAAMALEFALEGAKVVNHYDFNLRETEEATIVDWKPAIRSILADIKNKVAVSDIAARFHNTLVEIMVSIAYSLEDTNILLSGGCFQNRFLTERAIQRLREENFAPYWHQQIPPNDGGITVGQIIAASHLNS